VKIFASGWFRSIGAGTHRRARQCGGAGNTAGPVVETAYPLGGMVRPPSGSGLGGASRIRCHCKPTGEADFRGTCSGPASLFSMGLFSLGDPGGSGTPCSRGAGGSSGSGHGQRPAASGEHRKLPRGRPWAPGLRPTGLAVCSEDHYRLPTGGGLPGRGKMASTFRDLPFHRQNRLAAPAFFKDRRGKSGWNVAAHAGVHETRDPPRRGHIHLLQETMHAKRSRPEGDDHPPSRRGL
jgi:hypothetical protein